MTYIAIDTCPQLTEEKGNPQCWNMLGKTTSLTDARKLISNDAQSAWNRRENSAKASASEFFEHYLIFKEVEHIEIDVQPNGECRLRWPVS